MAETPLSLPAELHLLAIDPSSGGLLPRRRLRFRKALAAAEAAHRGGGGRPGVTASVRGRRRALRELEAADLLKSRRPFGRMRLADSSAAGVRFQRLLSCLRDGKDLPPRDRELALLLAWSGLLAERLSKGDRRIVARRLRGFLSPSI